MSTDVLVVAEHLDGALADITFELIAAAKQVGGCQVALIGGTSAMTGQLGAADGVITIGDENAASVAGFNPDTYVAAVAAAVEKVSPRIVMIAHTSMGMDLASPLAVRLDRPLATACQGIDGNTATVQLYGGKMEAQVDLGDGPCIVTMVAGAAGAEGGRAEGTPVVETLDAPPPSERVTFKRLVKPEAGDVDITAQEVLVAVGRGIGNQDGIEAAQELAEALGAEIAASRPIIDAGWLPKSRQVGKSGLKVKPKVYLALGISGAPEHLEGIKAASTIIAVNTDKNAPIFGVAHYGLAADLFDVCEELTEALED